jgi:hypothetical protein
MKLEITKEKVLEAASKCSEAKEILKTLFPEVFESLTFKKNCDFSSVLAEDETGQDVITIGNGAFGESGKYFFLSRKYTWRIDKDNLIPTKK